MRRRPHSRWHDILVTVAAVAAILCVLIAMFVTADQSHPITTSTPDLDRGSPTPLSRSSARTLQPRPPAQAQVRATTHPGSAISGESSEPARGPSSPRAGSHLLGGAA